MGDFEYEERFKDSVHSNQIIQDIDKVLENLTHRQAIGCKYMPKTNTFNIHIVELWQIKGVSIELQMNQLLELANELRINDPRIKEIVDPFRGDY